MADDSIAQRDNLIKIDHNHAMFVQSLAMCMKPRRILEFGYGAGEATRAILAGCRYNRQAFEYTLVDNWMDFSGVQPDSTRSEEFAGVNFVTSDELAFVAQIKTQYDFIFSDADHFNTQKWFDHVFTNVLEKNGVLFYHDVTYCTMFPNLMDIYTEVIKKNYHHILLNKRSFAEERCDRGLLAIFKH